MTIAFRPIGVIRTPHRTLDETPGQGAPAADSKGAAELFPEFGEGLKDIETFSHVILLYHLDRAWEVRLVRTATGDGKPHGVFASRHPAAGYQALHPEVRLFPGGERGLGGGRPGRNGHRAIASMSSFHFR